MCTRILPAVLFTIFLSACVTAQKTLLRQQVLRGYEFMMVSDYEALSGMLNPDAALHGADGKVVTREQIGKLAGQVLALKAGTLPQEEAARLKDFLSRRQQWAERAMLSVRFSSIIIRGDSATVTTLDCGTPGKIETSVYSFEKSGDIWKLSKEVSTHAPQPEK